MCKYFGDPELNSLTPEHWQRYLLHLRTEYQPKRFSGDQSPLSEATIDNHWKTIRGFYNWAVDNQLLSTNRPDLKLPRPKYSSPQVVPFTEDEVKRLLHACEFTTVVKQSGRTYKIKRQHADRDKAILMILLDTGMRLGEFYRLKVGDVNLENGEVYIRPVRDGRKSKGRTVFLGSRTKQIVWKYIAQRQARSDLSLPLFDLKASSIRLQINRIGHNAKVTHAYPHKFRHTFAVFYLRNGGDVFTLQRLLGHATLAMTLRYVNIVKDDLANAHKTASPVDNWRL
jgi:integrase/recombinase XerD